MKCVAYLSNPKFNPTREELDEMAAQFSFNNEKRSLTGFMIYDQRRFFQYLEGPEEEVIGIMDKIRKDKRHVIIAETYTNIDNRRFSSWAMNVLWIPSLIKILPENELMALITFTSKRPNLLPQWEVLVWNMIDEITNTKDSLV